MFSPAVHSIRQRIFGQIVHSPLASHSTKTNESDRVDILDPDKLLGADQVAFFDLKEHEDRYDVLMSTNFDFSSLNFTKNVFSINHIDIDTEVLVNALPVGGYSAQKFMYRLNALKLLLSYVRATKCAHPALVAQREALATAITVEMSDLVSNAISQWRLQSSGAQEGQGLRIVRTQDRRNHTYTSPLALSIMVLTAIIHTDMGASRASCNFILSALKAILLLAADMQGTHAQHFIQQHLRDSPDTLPMTLHFLNLPLPLQLYVTCPRCSCLFRYLDHVEMPETCTSTNVDGIICGERLFSNHYRGGKTRRVPVRHYSHQLFKTWLAELLLLPGVEDMLEAAAPSPKPLMTDVWDGTFLHGFPGSDEGDFFDAPKDELRLCMLLYHNFFNPLRNKAAGKVFSIRCFYMICLNLPADIRYDASFAYLASIVPGPSEPSMEALQLFVHPIAKEMAELYNPGIWIAQTHKYPNGRRVHAAVPLNSMDTPAARGFAGFASHGHTCFCYLCSATLDCIGANTLSKFTLQAVHTHRTQADQWENASSQALRDRLFATNGVRSCEWLRFGWWDMFAGTVIGPMHWVRNILDKHLHRNMNWSWNLLTGIPKPPPLSQPISKLEYKWAQRVLYELDQPSFAQYKLPGCHDHIRHDGI